MDNVIFWVQRGIAEITDLLSRSCQVVHNSFTESNKQSVWDDSEHRHFAFGILFKYSDWNWSLFDHFG